MKTFYIDCSPVIPEAREQFNFAKNAWISPSGDFYGFKGAEHERAATWIAVFKLGATENTLKKGTFFNQTWEGWLLSQGWFCIKNVNWMGYSEPSTFKSRAFLTEKQKSRLFDYCEAFGYNYEKILGENYDDNSL